MSHTGVLSHVLLRLTMMRLQRTYPCTNSSTTENDYLGATETLHMYPRTTEDDCAEATETLHMY